MYVAFDMLLLGDTCLTGRQLYERHLCLQSALVPVTGAVEIAEQIVSSDPNEIMVFLDQSVSAGCEGLMIKATDSAYEPSRRSSHWLKLKKDYLDGMGDTLDLVPVGAWLGRGKRHGAFGSYLMACYNAATNAYESIACVGTGMSEDEMRNF
jgi:DNA ligase-1